MDFMLAKTLNKKNIPKKWLLSEKYDGYRSRYEPDKGFISRNNNIFNAPEWYLDILPDISLDGELWAGYNKFQSLSKIRKKIIDPFEWLDIKYIVYDLPDLDMIFEERLKVLKNIVNKIQKDWYKKRKKLGKEFNNLKCPILLAEQIKIDSIKQFNQLYNKIINNDGEGVILKNPKSFYENDRSYNMLKYKPEFDTEAIIIDYKENKNKIVGAFICLELINFKNYSIINKKKKPIIISGLNYEIINNVDITHPIGTVITYKFSGLTESGKPRFAKYLRKREEIDVIDIKKHEKIVFDHIIDFFKKNSQIEKMNGSYKYISYENAIKSLKTYNLNYGLNNKKLFELKGIGKSFSNKIDKILKENKLI